MKILCLLVILISAFISIPAQTCSIPSLRGLKLGMTTQQVDALFISENDVIFFDDVRYQTTFSRNKLVKIVADYNIVGEWNNVAEFAEIYSSKLSLPNNWKSLENAKLLAELNDKKAKLLIKYSPEYSEIKQIDRQITFINKNSIPSLQCPTFTVFIEMPTLETPSVTLRLTNPASKNKSFTP